MKWRTLRANLKALRKRDGLTQSRAARAIGVELPTWGKWESDSVDRNPSPDSLDKIAKLFDVSVDDLFRVTVRTVSPNRKVAISLVLVRTQSFPLFLAGLSCGLMAIASFFQGPKHW